MGRFIRRAKRTVYENPWLRFEAHDIVHPSGAPGEHGVVVTPRASAVVAVEDGDVWLTRQARFAADRTLVEIVKGGANDGEAAQACAERELREELGIVAARWDDLGLTYELPSLVQEPVALFLARDVRHVPAELEEIESIEKVRIPFLAALDAVAAGELDDAVTAIALLRAARVLSADMT